MKALSIRQPWAWAILDGHKRVENRSWSVNYRGPLAIHASQSRRDLEGPTQRLAGMGIEVPKPESLDFGALIGVVELVDCVLLADAPELHDDELAEGPYCWIVENPRRLREPIPLRGYVSLFNVPEINPAALRRRVRKTRRSSPRAR